MLPAIAGVLVALAIMVLVLLTAFRTSKGRKLMTRLNVKVRATKLVNDNMKQGADARETSAQHQPSQMVLRYAA